MIKDAKLGKDISVTVVNKIGILADMAKILAEHGINMQGVAGYAKDGKKEAEMMLITDDNLRALDALKNNGYKSAREREVLIIDLENKVGALKIVTNKLAVAGIDINYIYGTACPSNCPARLIASTSDNEKAIVALKKP